METPYHIPVLLQEAIEGLAIQPSGIYVDCTLGGGGHARAILERLAEDGRLVAFDQDEDAMANLPEDSRVLFVPQNFRHLSRFLRLHDIGQVDGVLADLGVSSHQFDEAARGFSIRFDSSLDMRMDRRSSITAAAILNSKSEEELHKMFERYGEVTNSKTLARTIFAARGLSKIETVNQLKDVLSGIVKGNPNKYFAQVFQALRIAVNDELGALEELLRQLPAVVKKGGRVAIISFHSLEDRMIKRFFKDGDAAEADVVYGTRPQLAFRSINKKPIEPSQQEMKANPRSRSARLRIAERL